jgi:hypothetical protein
MSLTSEQYGEKLETHLQKRVQEEISASVTGGLFFYVASIIVTFCTFWFFYLVLMTTVGSLVSIPHRVKLVLCTAATVGIFVAHRRTAPGYFDEYPLTTLDDGPPVCVHIPHAGFLTNIVFLSPDTARGLAKMVLSILFIAPQLVAAGKGAFLRRNRLLALDISICAALLGYLVTQPKKVSFTELLRLFPQYPMSEVLPQLADIDGVVFLKTDPPGVSLTGDLRTEIQEHVLQGWKPLPVPEAPPQEPVFTPPPASPPRKPIPLHGRHKENDAPNNGL